MAGVFGESPGQTPYIRVETPLLERAQSLVDSLPELVRPSQASPHVRFAWEARDILVELLREIQRLQEMISAD